MNDNLISRNYIKLFVCDYEKYIENSIKVVKAVPIEAIDNASEILTSYRPNIRYFRSFDG